MNEGKEARFRNKVIWFSFAFSLLVVWVHSYNAELYLGKTAAMAEVYRIEHWLGDHISQIAVPGFFMISGYLFYRDFSWGRLKEKWQRRIRSVLVPYILWNFLYYLGYVIASRLPWLGEVVGKGVIPFRLAAAADAVINYTYNYVFWYLFQLILLILLAPALYPVLRRNAGRAVFFAALTLVLWLDIPLPLLNADALFYYGAAACMALSSRMRGIVEERECEARCAEDSGKDTAKRGAVGALCLAAAVWFYRTGLSHAWVFGFVLCRLLSVAGLWLLVPAEKLPPARDCMKQNFFLYATHFALVRFLNKAGAELLCETAAVPLLLFFLMPVLVLAVCTLLGKVLRSLSPALWELLNGGR